MVSIVQCCTNYPTYYASLWTKVSVQIILTIPEQSRFCLNKWKSFQTILKFFIKVLKFFFQKYNKFLDVKIFWSAAWCFVPSSCSGGLCGRELFNGEVLLCKLQVRASVVSLSHQQWTGHNRTCLPQPVLLKYNKCCHFIGPALKLVCSNRQG